MHLCVLSTSIVNYLSLIAGIQGMQIFITWFHCLTDSVEEDKMLAEGVSRFCEDANLDPTGLPVLIMAWKFKAATQCEFTRKEFVEGMTDLGWVLFAETFKCVFVCCFVYKYTCKHNNVSCTVHGTELFF